MAGGTAGNNDGAVVADLSLGMYATDSFEDRGESGAEPFRIVVSQSSAVTVVVPHGELDLATAAELETAIAAQTGRVVVDLRGLSFVDASGLRVLLEADARSRQDGGNLRFVPGEQTDLLFELAGLDDPLAYIEPPGG